MQETRHNGGQAISWLKLSIITTFLFSAPIVSAQIVLDGSLGTEGALNGPDFQISEDLGQLRGTNLFHSFSDFNIAADESATFSGPASVANIMSRITGGNVSNIEGALRSEIAGANLFLLNPAGIIFGENASLDVGGSFHVSTADYLRFADGQLFLADAEANVSLSVAAPSSFGFLGDGPGFIEVNETNLLVPGTNTISIVGGEVSLIGASISTAEAGTVQIIGLNSAGEVSIDTGEITGANRLADINMRSGTFTTSINVDGIGEAGILVYGDNIQLEGTNLAASNDGDTQSRGVEIVADGQLHFFNSNISGAAENSGDAGDILIRANDFHLEYFSEINGSSSGSGRGADIVIDIAERMLLADNVQIDSSNNDEGGDSGNIFVRAADIEWRSSGEISSSNFGTGEPGQIHIQADRLRVEGSGGNTTRTGIIANSDSTRTAPGILIETISLEMLNGASIISNANDEGDGGQIMVETDRLLISRNGSRSFTGIESSANSGASGNGGEVLVYASDIEIRDGGAISSNTFGQGNAGRVAIETEQLLIQGNNSGVLSEAQPPSTGNSGEVSVQATNITVADGASIGTSSFSEGKAGLVDIKTKNLSISGGSEEIVFTGIASDAESSGDGGTVRVEASNINILDFGTIRSGAFGSGNAGIVDIDAERILVSGEGAPFIMGIRSNAIPGSTGNAGQVIIDASEIELRNGAVIASSTFGEGNAGSITIQSDRLFISQDPGEKFTGITSSVSPSATNGRGGEVIIHVTDLEMRGSTEIRSSTFSDGDAGSVTVNAKNILISRGQSPDASGILSTSETSATGNAGNVTVTAQNIEILDGAAITTSSFGAGDAGRVVVKTDSLGITGRGDPSRKGGFTGISSFSRINSTGNAGDVDVTANELTINMGGGIASSSTRDTFPGNISINVVGDIRLAEGSSISTDTVNDFDPSNPASISLQASNVFLDQGSNITSRASDAADAGNIDVRVTDTLSLRNNSFITTESTAGSGGIINIQADYMLRLENSEITTSVLSNSGQGGNIFIDPVFVILKNSAIIAQASEGAGGNIDIITDFLFRSPNSIIDASSTLGIDGTVDINVLETDIDRDLIDLPANFLDPSRWLKTPCAKRAGDQSSHLVMQGRNGAYQSPEDIMLPGRHLLQNEADTAPGDIDSNKPQFISLRSITPATETYRAGFITNFYKCIKPHAL